MASVRDLNGFHCFWDASLAVGVEELKAVGTDAFEILALHRWYLLVV